ncbi:MAG: 16S rRNA (uracil(1498)-N(3))-methyltransferase [Hyphomicrobiaceae bacterium]
MSEPYDFRAQRLYVVDDLASGVRLALSREHANYLINVLRLNDGARLHVFNGRHGEWRAHVRREGKRAAALEIQEQIRQQTSGPDLHYVFAPLKRSRLDYMVQKAVELGSSCLVPVITQHTVAERINLDRMKANVIEAAEQCGILRIPDVAQPMALTHLLDGWPGDRRLIFCDEAAPDPDPVRTLRTLPEGPLAVLIGPEGGFSDGERQRLANLDFAVRLSLGPRIMRADTAAVAALSLVNAVLGDWRDLGPRHG